MSLKELRENSRVGVFTLFDFAASYVVVYILWFIYNSYKKSPNNGIILLEMLLSVIPLSVLFHIISKQNTPLTDMALGKRGSMNQFLSLSVIIISLLIMYILPNQYWKY